MQRQILALILAAGALGLAACKKPAETTAPPPSDVAAPPPADASMIGAPDASGAQPAGPQPSANSSDAAPGAVGTATSQSTGSVPGSTLPAR